MCYVIPSLCISYRNIMRPSQNLQLQCEHNEQKIICCRKFDHVESYLPPHFLSMDSPSGPSKRPPTERTHTHTHTRNRAQFKGSRPKPCLDLASRNPIVYKPKIRSRPYLESRQSRKSHDFYLDMTVSPKYPVPACFQSIDGLSWKLLPNPARKSKKQMSLSSWFPCLTTKLTKSRLLE